MKDRRIYDIDIIKLGEKKHTFNYDITSSFFENFEDSIIETGKLTVDLILDKSSTMIRASFIIKGAIELTCDRSMEQFDFNVDTNNSLIFKFGEEFAELTEEIITIPRDYPTLNMAQYIYEFIGLAIPMKKLHPKFVNEDELQDADTVLIYSSGEPEEAKNETTGEESNDDPRWNILKNIRNNYN